MHAWFVTGTDTGVGKTVATAALAVALADQKPYILKPAQTGVLGTAPGDLDDVRRLAGDVPGAEGVRLGPALAPEAAARIEGVELPSLAAQTSAIVDLASRHTVIVEGAGGVLVRLGFRWNMMDLARQVAAAGVESRFLVVARPGLGTLNHTALTVDAVQRAGHTVSGILIGSWPADPDLAERENLVDLPEMTGIPLIGRIPAGAGDFSSEQFRAGVAGWLELPE